MLEVVKAVQEDTNWVEVQAKALAYIAFHLSQLNEEELAVKAGFFDGLGVPREDAAKLLGSSAESIRKSLERQAKEGGKHGKKASTRKR